MCLSPCFLLFFVIPCSADIGQTDIEADISPGRLSYCVFVQRRRRGHFHALALSFNEGLAWFWCRLFYVCLNTTESSTVLLVYDDIA